MEKSTSNLYRYDEVAKACNGRFLDAMTDIVPIKFTLDEIGKSALERKSKAKSSLASTSGTLK